MAVEEGALAEDLGEAAEGAGSYGFFVIFEIESLGISGCK